jgi:hypothetical protein
LRRALIGLALAAACALAGGLTLAGCPLSHDPFPGKTCSTNEDCFQGEMCIQMVCTAMQDLAMPDMALPIIDFSTPGADQ